MDPPSPPARINSTRASPTKTPASSGVDISQPEARTSQSSLWLDRSLHLPCDFSSRSSSRLSSVAMISQSAAAEELNRATVDLENTRNTNRRMAERPSVRLASMAQTFNIDNDNYKRKYQELLQEKISTEENHSKTKRELVDTQRVVETLTAAVAAERRNIEKWIAQHREVSDKCADLEATHGKKMAAAEEEAVALKATIDANLRCHTEELMEVREEARQTVNERVASATAELRRTADERYQQVSDLRRTLELARTEVERLEDNKESLENTIAAMDRVHAAALKLSEEDAEERLAKADQKARQWEDDMVEQGMRMRSMQQDLVSANASVTQFKQEAARVRGDLDGFREEVSRQRAEDDRRHASDMSHMRSQLQDSTEQLAHYKSEASNKDDMLHQLHSEQKRLRASLNDANETVTFLRAECDSSKRTTEDAIHRLHDLQSAYDNLTEDYEGVCEKLLQRMEAQNQTEDASVTQAKFDRLKQEFDAAHDQWREQRTHLMQAETAAHEKNVKLQDEIATVEANLRAARSSGIPDSTHTRQLRTELADAVANNISLMRQLDDSKEKCFQLKSDISKYQTQISELERSQVPSFTHSSQVSNPDSEETAPRRVRGEKASRSALGDINLASRNYCPEPEVTSSKLQAFTAIPSVQKRPAAAAVFAVTGIPASGALVDGIASIPNASVCSAPSDAPIPSEVTHVISNGNLTVKVLTALVRGCWVLPPTYVSQCTSSGLASESQYGFRHSDLPLAGKVIGITAGFRQGQYGKHLQDIAQEGGATIKFINMTTDDAREIRRYSMVACLKAEQQSFPNNGKTWEAIVQILFPTTVQNSLKKEYMAFSNSLMSSSAANNNAVTASTIPFRSAPSSVAPVY